MRSLEDKECLNHGLAQEEIARSTDVNFEFSRGNRGNQNQTPQQLVALGKPTPSKWDDAQKWLVNLSKKGERSQLKTMPCNLNADDKRFIDPLPKKEDYSSNEDEQGNESATAIQYEFETKSVACDESIWQINKASENSTSDVRTICVRDMGTDMTPVASQEPSRTATPIRATTPAMRSPISSASSTPVRSQIGMNRGEACRLSQDGKPIVNNACENKNSDQTRGLDPLETQATAWDEAECAKYMARYKHEELRIQAWENNEKRKAEMEMQRIEVKAERLKSKAQERYINKIAATSRIAEGRRANAEAKLNEKAVRTSERADYIRRTGHMPSSFSMKLPSCCW